MLNLPQSLEGEADETLTRPAKRAGLCGRPVERSDSSQCSGRPGLPELP